MFLYLMAFLKSRRIPLYFRTGEIIASHHPAFLYWQHGLNMHFGYRGMIARKDLSFPVHPEAKKHPKKSKRLFLLQVWSGSIKAQIFLLLSGVSEV
jgi:hypothetical protein